MEIKPKIKGMTIVLIGDFNPKILSPVWHANQGLIRKEEGEKAETQIVHPDVTTFNLDWMRFQVTRNQYVLETWQETCEDILHDIVLGTFRLLRHTPLKKLGINTQSHFKIDSEEQWHEIGHKLAPKEIWKNVFKNPGMVSLTMQDMPRTDGLNGYIRVDAQPSTRVHPGVFIRVNDHYEAKDISSVTGADEIIDIFENNWNNSLEHSTNIITTLMEQLI